MSLSLLLPGMSIAKENYNSKKMVFNVFHFGSWLAGRKTNIRAFANAEKILSLVF